MWKTITNHIEASKDNLKPVRISMTVASLSVHNVYANPFMPWWSLVCPSQGGNPRPNAWEADMLT